MGGFDDHVAIMGDWMPPSPSPRAFFSSILGDDLGTRSAAEPTRENKTGTLVSEPEGYASSRNSDGKGGDQAGSMSSLSEQKIGSRGGGLLERMAARAGFNAPRLNTESIRTADLSQNQEVRSPYLTIPPGLSPTTLLDSPVFLSNSLAQPSPTTGKFPFPSSGDIQNSTMFMEASHKSKESSFDNNDSSSFAFQPVFQTGPSIFPGTFGKVPPSNLARQSFPSVEPTQVYAQNGTIQRPDFARSSTEKDNGSGNITSEHSPPPDELPDEETDQRGSGDPNFLGAPADDGYNWRKYGQKQVKGSEYPRSYYKCTHLNCPVKKKVERSQEGHITEIIYKGAHNHPKPTPNRRSALGSANPLGDMQIENTEQAGTGGDGDPIWANMQKGSGAGDPDWRNDNLEVTTSAPLGSEYCNGSSFQAQNVTQFESGDAVDRSCTFSNDEDEDDRGTHGSVSLGYDGEGDESESKRRKIETYAADMSGATRAIREPRVVVQTTSEVDILDDGYRWRKYGQKVVKGNPNPRSYYKCTSAGCTVRKHVERASHDLKSVITTYEGKHNHDVPAARNSSHVNSGVSNSGPSQATAPTQSHLHRPEPSQLQNTMARFEGPLSLGSFGLAGRPPQLGGTPGFGFGMNPQGLTNLAMAGLGTNPGKLPVLPVHPYLGQQRPVNHMSFMMSKGEPKMEPVSDPGLNISNSSSVYQQVMSRLPLGPHM
nr:probable WRKY transcription factor 2 isoform X1 [Ipomoea batatas]